MTKKRPRRPFYQKNHKILLSNSRYKFVFEVKNLSQFIVFKDNQVIKVNHIMPHFLNVAVGTMRGILVVKTAGTNFSKYPLPMIDVNQLNANLSAQV